MGIFRRLPEPRGTETERRSWVRQIRFTPTGSGSDTRVSDRSVKDQRSGDDQDLCPSDYSTDSTECAADGFTCSEDCPSPGRGERLLEALPLVLPDGTPAQQAMRVFPAPFTLPGLRSTRYGSLEQEVPESSQRQGQNHSQPKVMQKISGYGDDDSQVTQ